jgi:hypothetical protein
VEDSLRQSGHGQFNFTASCEMGIGKVNLDEVDVDELIILLDP